MVLQPLGSDQENVVCTFFQLCYRDFVFHEYGIAYNIIDTFIFFNFVRELQI